jgi:peptide/nickel transport system ATP-binding protein
MAAELLTVDGLSVDLHLRRGRVRVVRDVSLSMRSGRNLGLVGESGSGKSLLSLAMCGLLPHVASVTAGRVVLDGRDLTAASEQELADVRGREIGMIFQEPSRSLDPAFSVGSQISEVLRRHLGLARAAAWERAVELLDLVGIRDPRHRALDYPHMLSGGMCQRVMLAIAVVCRPKLLVADEPTTALDVTVQRRVLDLMLDLGEQMGMAILFISHDLGVISEMCDDIAVMYAGRIVESGRLEEVFTSPAHPYTEGLIGSVIGDRQRGGRLVAIPGTVPALADIGEQCAFADRCAYAEPGCRAAEPPLAVLGPGRATACIRHDELRLEGVV